MTHASAPSSDDRRFEPDVIIRPLAKAHPLDPRELFANRHILFSLIKREVKRQFQNMYLGWLWIFARPLVMVVIFVLFKRGSRAALEVTQPYPAYLYAGLLLWFTFSDATSAAAGSGQANANLISKIYYPRIFNPLSAAFGQFSRMGIGLLPFVAMMPVLQFYPGWNIFLLPMVLLQATLLAFAVGTIFAILSTTNDDWNKLLGLLLYVGVFVSPVIYSVSMIPESFRILYSVNPMVGTLTALRACLFSDMAFPWLAWAYSTAFTAGMAALALWLFRRTEAKFLDEL